jgi:hypothetical protein
MTEVTEKRPFSSIPIPIGSIVLDRETEKEFVEAPIDRKVVSADALPQQSFMGMLKSIIRSNYKGLPKRLLKEIYWLGPLVIIWMGLWTMSPMTLMALPGPLKPLAWFFIFLTATYNGFIGKAAFITVMSRTFIPLIKRIKAGEMNEIKAKYGQTAAMIRTILFKSKRYTLKIFLISAGLGLIASNILTRNNKIDKYLICVLCAVALFDDLSKGKGSPIVRLVSTGLRDLPILAGKKLKVSMQSTYLTVACFAIGLVLAIVPGQFVNTFVSPLGAIFGAVLMIAGIGLHFLEGKNAEKGQ